MAATLTAEALSDPARAWTAVALIFGTLGILAAALAFGPRRGAAMPMILDPVSGKSVWLDPRPKPKRRG